MRALPTYLLVLTLLASSGLLAQTPAPADPAAASASAGATKEEVNELRGEVAAQRKTIEELKGLVEKLAQEKANPTASGSVEVRPVADRSGEADGQPAEDSLESGVQLKNAVLREPDLTTIEATLNQAASAAPKKEAPLSAGWNGEHFFIRSADGQFTISPYGYVDDDYRAYKGDGAPADTFVLRRARFGFQGSYGSHFDFALLTDVAASTGATIRDVYLNIRVNHELQLQAGQFKVPFGQEAGMGVTNLDFVERGFQSMLYPSAATAYRSPGAVLHGDISGGVVQYFVGAFNGRGYALNNASNQAEILGRLRFYPFRKSKNDWWKQFVFGGSVDHSLSAALYHDQSFSGNLPNAAYNFFPQFPINGDIWRYNGEFTYIKSNFALRAEYDQLAMDRTNIGSYQAGGLGYLSLPRIKARAWDLHATYLLTGEKRPENGAPRVKHPLFGPDTPGGQGRGMGAWEVAFRFTGAQAKEPGANFLNFYTPGFVPTYSYHTDELTFGVNWYPNYWVRYMVNLAVDRLKDPSLIGAVPQNYYVVLQRLQFRF